ncbi:ABC transporter ATP-binding protein [Bacillus sp. DTU_2020_1000418_1_SI_GHA_SEK_038]|uniref:ABC transporter ATP-binding protein n=1 Tax=Bacillus sp. DTU_2020_1000418_1_SI_GHA_SEK_038 TaxID=3077585 RepID=UPI0028E9355F|nr:ABC transporter ATP-binding protein [Bacillus sp. DTU_2020_1000418_1_SI_GHA_SEK_038]WNS74715.1 ABC transporter ATP-binding protein [Bacillus sp. DTU_2020_1000418_1_SI_GHA_SEK_038]
MEKILDVKNLQVSFNTYAGEVKAVRGVSFHLNKGETLAIVGESGSGKSVTSKSLMKLIPNPPGKITGGEILFEGKNLVEFSEKQMQKIRGSEIAMIFQDPMTSLNPTMTVGKQIMESIIKHQKLTKQQAKDKAIELLDMVGIPNAEKRLASYPHQFSGGMRQRVVIAMAISCNPKVLIADEPTTALDVTIQAQILELLKDLQKKLDTSIIFITHDLGVVANIADRVAVMYAGKIIEIGTVDEIFYNPQHPYTWGLLGAMPNLNEKAEELITIPGSPPDLLNPPIGDAFANRNKYAMNIDFQIEPPMFKVSDTHYAATWLLHEKAPKMMPPDVLKKHRQESPKEKQKERLAKKRETKEKLLEIKNLKQYFTSGSNIVKAVDGINFDIYKGETFGLVGESGCGKSTTGRTIIGLYDATDGDILYNNEKISTKKTFSEAQILKRKIQMIFQDPYSSLNPRQTVADIIAEGMDIHGLALSKKERIEKVYELLETVGLNREHANRYPHEFSGGQRQRIGIARALAVDPEFIIADEPISALDVSIQAQVVNLMKKLQKEKGLTYLFIAHDLSMVKYISDRIGVMYKGRMVELAESDELYDNPLHPYTKSLLSAIPLPDPETEKTRTRLKFDQSFVWDGKGEEPILREVKDGHWVACTQQEYEEYKIQNMDVI